MYMYMCVCVCMYIYIYTYIYIYAYTRAQEAGPRTPGGPPSARMGAAAT